MKRSSWFWLSAAALCYSCATKTPSDVLSKGKMENVLYDYMLAQSLGNLATDSVDYKIRLYTEAVFKKYNITQKDFDHSMQYYTRHSDVLYQMYQDVRNRFEQKLGSAQSVSESGTATGDTLRLWQGAPMAVLSPETSKHLNFAFPNKMDLKKGDVLLFRFEPKWLYPSGERSATLVLSVTYDNDSVTSYSKEVYDSNWQVLQCTIGERSVKRVNAFVYQNAGWGKKPYLFMVGHPQLMRIREKHPEDKVEEVQSGNGGGQPNSDTLQKTVEQRLQDSLMQIEEQEQSGTHFL